MNNNIPAPNNFRDLKVALSKESVAKRFSDMLGKKAPGFISSITSVVGNNELLKKADVNSVILAAANAASFDLPINPNLGYSAIIPFYDNKTKGYAAQFQIMRNGWVELLHRTGQLEALVNEPVYEGELVKKNRFTDEYVFDEDNRTSNTVIGYMAYVKLNTGFKKTVFWTIDEVKKHAQKYSQTYKKGYGLWVDNFEAMALKTVLKHLINKYLPKSIELQRAIETDQAAFSGDINSPKIDYIDNHKEDISPIEYEEVTDEEETATTESDIQPDQANPTLI